MHSTAVSSPILPFTKTLSAATVGWLMWLRKEGIEVDWGGGAHISPTIPYFLSQGETWASANEHHVSSETEVVVWGEGGSHFESSLGLKNAVMSDKCEMAIKKKKNGSGCYWVMVTAMLVLCSAGCIITSALNTHIWVESLNGLVALNKAGKEANLLTLTLPPLTDSD